MREETKRYEFQEEEAVINGRGLVHWEGREKLYLNVQSKSKSTGIRERKKGKLFLGWGHGSMGLGVAEESSVEVEDSVKKGTWKEELLHGEIG